MEKTVVISVSGMSCGHCVKAVTDALSAHKSVKDVKVSLNDKNARIVYDDELGSLDDLKSLIIEEGFSVN
jgi:copper chaperone CopZ